MRVRREGEKVEVRIIRLRTEWWVRTWKDRVLSSSPVHESVLLGHSC